jgi:hypothetical protein
MELSVSSTDGRREERMPLDVLVELRSDEGDEMLEADGLDVSPHGMAVRASFVPNLGAELRCQFRCPPTGELVRAEGVVVWAQWSGPRVGTFGIRFVALDTRSATVIRHYLEPEEEQAAPEPELPRVATLRIDGLGAPIEADVRLADDGRVVLEQELSFLKLGRGVAVEVPGRGKQRGRIGSVELRQGHTDVPTLVFGILLDEATRAEEAPDREPVAVRVASTPRVAEPAPLAVPEAAEAEAAPAEPEEEPRPDTWPGRPAFALEEASHDDDVFVDTEQKPAATPVELEGHDELPVPRAARKRTEEEARPTNADAEDRWRAHDDALGMGERVPLWARKGTGVLVASLLWLRSVFVPLWERVQTGSARLREQGWPLVRERVSAWLGAAMLMARKQGQRIKEARSEQRVQRQQQTTRVQRPQGGREHGREPAQAAEPRREQRPPRNRRVFAATLAGTGIALGVYALAPTSDADRLRTSRESLRTELAPPETLAEPPPEAAQPAAPVANPAYPAVAPGAPAAAAPAALPAELPGAVTPPAPGGGDLKPLTFGQGEVPNGRTFVLRMSGPVEELEGDQREDGFTVRVPGRLALDRASPIATSHRAVARAMILNRGDYAELTVDFLPGMRPKYQIVGKDATIEVTLERQ